MKYIINGTEYTTAREAADYIMEQADESYYDDMLDECNADIVICSMIYAPSIALYRVDPIAYQCGRNDWEDAEASNIAHDLDYADDGETLEFYGVSVECVDDDGEEA